MLSAFDEIEDNLTGGEPLAKRIYDALWANLGDNYAREGYTDAKVFATARALARLSKTRERLDAQLDPATCLELLPDREREYGIVVPATATIASRRAVLAAAMAAGQAGTLGNLLQAFADLLGADFVDYRPTPRDAAAVYPGNPANGPGNHAAPGAPKRLFRLVGSYSALGLTTLTITHPDGSVPTDAEVPQPGEYVVIEPDHNVLRERVQVVAAGPVGPACYLLATLAKAHHAGAWVVSGRWPYWASTKRFNTIRLTEDAALDATARTKANALAARMTRAVSTWAITGNDGAFVIGESPLGVTPL